MSAIRPQQSLLVRLLLRVRPHALTSILKPLLGIRRQVIQVESGARYWIDPVSNLGRFLSAGNLYEPEVGELIAKLLQPGNTFVDVGANEGYFSVLAGRIVGPKGTVISVEPQQRLKAVIERNRQLNQLEGVLHHVPFGIGAAEGVAQLQLASDVNTGASGAKRFWFIGAGEQPMKIKSLESLAQEFHLEQIHLLKVDCEGGEVGVLEGAQRLLKNHQIHHLLVEYHPHILGKRECERLHQLILAAQYTAKRFGEHTLYSCPSGEPA